MGTGKTLPVVAAVNAMDDIQRVAVFCPPSVTYVWGAEFLKHTPKETGWLVEFMSDKRSWGSPDQPRGSVLVANAKTVTKRVDRARDVSSVCHALNRKFVVVFNYQVMYRNDVKAFLNEGSWDLIVYDEAHCIKKPGGVQSKTAKEFRKVSRRRVCLSGTPMDKPHDIYAQARALDPAIFGDNFQRFKHRYPFDGVVTFDMDQHGFKVTGDYAITRRIMNFPKGDRGWRGSYWWVRHGFSQAARLCLDFNDVSVSTTDAFRLACDNLKCDEYTRLTTVDMAAARAEFQQKLGRFMDKVRAEDVLTLPECTQAFRKVELGNKAARIYRDLHKHLYAEVQADGVEGVIRAGNPLAKLMRLQQVTSGCIPLIPRATFENLDDVDWQYVDDAKETALGEFLEGLSPDECVVAFTRFKTDLEAVERVAGKLGRKVAFIRGGRNDIGHKWTDDPSTEAGQATVAAVQVQAGGVGIDLTRARYAWFHSLSWSGPEFSQAMKRIHRHGQDRPVTIMHCVASGTVDEQIYEALAAKKEVVDHVLGALVRPEDLA
jgi:SNF2 family DNA or RNA helicase